MSALTPSFTTPDLPRCLAFYRDALGFTCTGEIEQEGRVTWAELTRDAAKLMLLAAEQHPEDAGARYDAAGVIFYLEVDRLGALRRDLINRGLTVSPMEVTFYGMREVYVRDPDGRQLTLAEPSEAGDEVTVHEL